MQGTVFPIHFRVFGALTADEYFQFKAPFELQLIQVDGNAANTTTCIIDIGTVADADAYLDNKTLTGATDTPTTWDRDDFVADSNGVGQYPAIPKDTVVEIAVDYDGGAGGNVDDLMLTLWFTY